MILRSKIDLAKPDLANFAHKLIWLAKLRLAQPNIACDAKLATKGASPFGNPEMI